VIWQTLINYFRSNFLSSQEEKKDLWSMFLTLGSTEKKCKVAGLYYLLEKFRLDTCNWRWQFDNPLSKVFFLDTIYFWFNTCLFSKVFMHPYSIFHMTWLVVCVVKWPHFMFTHSFNFSFLPQKYTIQTLTGLSINFAKSSLNPSFLPPVSQAKACVIYIYGTQKGILHKIGRDVVKEKASVSL